MQIWSHVGDADTHLAAPSGRRAAAALLPSLVLRVTWRGRAASDAAQYDTMAEAWRWPVPFGLSFELRAVWSLDRLISPVHGRGIDLDPDPDPPEDP